MKRKRKLRKEIKWLLTGLVLSQSITYAINAYNSHLQSDREILEQFVHEHKADQQLAFKTNETREVLVTNYYFGDGSSGKTTASGYSIKDFEVKDGMYTWNGMIVLATAHETLGNVKEGFITHELYEELTITFNDTTYQGIILDKCGTCTWGNDFEELQRVDVFTTGELIGKVKGVIEW